MCTTPSSLSTPGTAPHLLPSTPKSRRLIAKVVSKPASLPIFGRSRMPRKAGRNCTRRVTPWIVRLAVTTPVCPALAVLLLRVEAGALHDHVDARALRRGRVVLERAVEVAEDALFLQHAPLHDREADVGVDGADERARRRGAGVRGNEQQKQQPLHFAPPRRKSCVPWRTPFASRVSGIAFGPSKRIMSGCPS